MPYLNCFENKNPWIWSLFFPAVHDVQVNVHTRPIFLLKMIFFFPLDSHNCRTDWHSGGVSGGGPHYEFSCCTCWKNSIKVLLSTSPAWAVCVWQAVALACCDCLYRYIILFAQSLCIRGMSPPSGPSAAWPQWIRVEGAVETVTWVLLQGTEMVEGGWSDPLGISREGLIVFMGNDCFFFQGYPDKTPKCRGGSALRVWTQASSNVYPLCGALKSFPETCSWGLRGLISDIDRRDSIEEFVHNREIMKLACEWLDAT